MDIDNNYLKKQADYIETMGKDVDKKDYFSLFPVNWHANKDYKLKEEILDEALLKKCLIIDTSLYENTMQERVIDLSAMLDSKQNIKRNE